ncbi:phage N-6-adenine-methyltransferase, partial [Escherichia coli]|nr:phage N-6-adenine-methyltransferase [Escherichia coli]MBB2234731.1 phage N-6-adenine-methyltransferase [Escherichia coli]MBB2394187.1 phage N-6-adenine-methyltransferase [Escherichia coli]MBB6777824.1 phage N-6-adenine-methyltransferase [Escherichia coli]MBB8243112.1 phage N-6-adenine-methyltransferase [Escherichia coli]
RASQHEGQYITGMRYIMKHASAMRDKGEGTMSALPW